MTCLQPLAIEAGGSLAE